MSLANALMEILYNNRPADGWVQHGFVSQINMKTKSIAILALIITLFGCSGENSKQREAYEAAYKTEQEYALSGGGAGPLIIQQYQVVIQIDPNSSLAKIAQQRIDVATKNWNDYQARMQERLRR